MQGSHESLAASSPSHSLDLLTTQQRFAQASPCTSFLHPKPKPFGIKEVSLIIIWWVGFLPEEFIGAEIDPLPGIDMHVCRNAAVGKMYS